MLASTCPNVMIKRNKMPDMKLNGGKLSLLATVIFGSIICRRKIAHHF